MEFEWLLLNQVDLPGDEDLEIQQDLDVSEIYALWRLSGGARMCLGDEDGPNHLIVEGVGVLDVLEF